MVSMFLLSNRQHQRNKKFIDDYSNVSGMKVYGMEKFLYQYLAEEFDDNIEYDSSKIKLWSLDIETIRERFPQTRTC